MSLKTTCRANAVSIRTGTSGVRAGEPGRVLAHDLHGDVGPGVARPDDQHPAVPELCGPAVVAGVELDDRRVELVSQYGHARLAVGSRRHDHVLGLDPEVPGPNEEAAGIAVAGYPIHTGIRANGQLEP